MECIIPPRLKSCPSSLPQATAEAQAASGTLPFTAATLDRKVVDGLSQFLNIVLERWRMSQEGRKSYSAVAYLEGMWGYGKSFYAKYFVERLAPEKGVHAVYEVFDNIRSIVNKLAASGVENPEIMSEKIARHLLSKALEGKPVVAVLDEVESLVTASWTGTREEKILVDAFIHLYQSLVNPEIEHLSWARGRLHLVLVLTPAASIRLSRILDEALKGGKLLRRYDVIITLNPVPKYVAVKIAEEYLENTLGIELTDLLRDKSYFNSIYTATGGSPGTMILLLNQIAREASQNCQREYTDCCICGMNAWELAKTLSRVETVSPEGDKYRPGTDLLRSLADTLSESLLSRLLSLSPIEREEARELESIADLRCEKVKVYGPLTREKAAAWVDMATEILCGGNEKCRSMARTGLQYMLYMDSNDRYYVILPERERLGDWLLYYGYEEPVSSEEAAKIASLLHRPAKEAYILPPSDAHKLFSSPIEAGLDYVSDRRAKEYARTAVKHLIEDHVKLLARASRGLETALRLSSIYGEGPPWLELEGNELKYRYEISNIKYSLPLRFHPSSRKPEEEKPSIIVTINGPGEATSVNDRMISLSLGEGDLRFLAILSLITDEYGNDALDPSRVAERLRNILLSTRLSDLLYKVAEWMRDHGYIIVPLRHEASFGKLVGSLKDRFKAMSDIARYLAVLGGYKDYIPRSMIVDFLWNMIATTPYSTKSRWCGVVMPQIGSYSDLKDASSHDKVESIVDASLLALRAENLVDAASGENEEGYKLTIDEIAQHMPKELIGIRDKDFDKKVHKYYILPSDKANMEQALERLRLRKKILTILYDNSLDARRLAGLEQRAEKAWKTLREARDKASDLSREIETWTGKNPENLALSLVVCKEKACKIIDAETIESLLNTIGTVIRKLAKRPSTTVRESEKIVDFAIDLAGGMAKIIGIAADFARARIDENINKYNLEINNYIKNIEKSLTIISGRGLSLLASETMRAVEELMQRINSEQTRRLQASLYIAMNTLEEARAGKLHRKGLANFRRCDGSQAGGHIINYYPLGIGVEEALNNVQKSGVFMEVYNRIIDISRAAEELAQLLENIDTELAKAVRSDVPSDLQKLTDGELVRSIIRVMNGLSSNLRTRQDQLRERERRKERVRERLRNAKDLYKTAYKNILEADKIVDRIMDLLDDGLEDANSLKDRVNKAQKDSHQVNLELNSIEEECLEQTGSSWSEICEWKVDNAYQAARRLYEDAQSLIVDVRRIENSMITTLRDRVQKLAAMLEAYRLVLLQELQAGNETLESLVKEVTSLSRKAVDLRDGLLNLEPGKLNILEKFATSLERLEDEWKRLRERFRAEIGRATMLLEVLDDIRRRGLTLEELVDSIPSDADIAGTLRRLAALARRTGHVIIVDIEREKR